MAVTDFHNHFYPPEYLDAIRTGPSRVGVTFDPDRNPMLHYPGDYNIAVPGHRDIAYRDELEIKRIMRLKPELHLNVRSVLINDKKDMIAVAAPYASTQLASLANVILLKRKKIDANQLLDEYADIFATG